MSQYFDILGVRFSALDLIQATQEIARMVEGKRKGYACVCPVSTIVEAQEDSSFLKIVNSADIVTTDGIPSVWIGRWKGHKNIGRVYGPDLMSEACKLSQEKGYRNYFYGSTPWVLQQLRNKLLDRFPQLQICGMYAPPFRPLTPSEDQEVIDNINTAKPDILWVGLGSPKQDRWIYEHKDQLNVGVSLAVGAAFDFLAGTKPQAPRWMQCSGLEWLFRLCCEPTRLWKRYLIGNSKFIWYLLQDSLKKKHGRTYDS